MTAEQDDRSKPEPLQRFSRRNLLGVGLGVGVGIGAAAGASAALGLSAGSTSGSPVVVDDSAALTDPGGDEPVDAVDPGELPQLASTFFATVFVEHAGTMPTPSSDGDLWPNCWADDDNVYAANGDGRGFSDEEFKDVVVNRILGDPATGFFGARLAAADQVARIWGDPTKYNRKPTGMVCVGGVLYLAVQDLRFAEPAFDDAPNASISRSDDHGVTWTKTTEPMFTDHRFTTIFFADFGRDSVHARAALGEHDGSFVYAYGLDWNWRMSVAGVVPNPVDLYLARVPATAVQDRSQWRFFTGTDSRGAPVWSSAIEDKAPVLHDPLRRFTDAQTGHGGNLTVISQGGVLYNAPLKRYLYTSWTDPSFEFYEAPNPWGPWKRFLYHNAGLAPWYRSDDLTNTPKNGGYATTMPSKYVSADGRDLWLQSNWWEAPAPTPEDNYNFNLRRVHLTPYSQARARAPESPSPGSSSTPATTGANLARTGADVTAVLVAVRHAHWEYLNDGDRSQSEDSFDATNKTSDHWGYSFSRAYSIERVEYTTGAMADDGGWFSAYAGGLRVQVRQQFRWSDVENLQISPDYPYDASAGPHRTFSLRFTPTWGDGVRIIGQPAGSGHYTSIAELEVY